MLANFESLKGPIDVEIIIKKNGSKRMLLNNVDVSMMVTRFDIRNGPASLSELVVTIPIGHITIRDEWVEAPTIID